MDPKYIPSILRNICCNSAQSLVYLFNYYIEKNIAYLAHIDNNTQFACTSQNKTELKGRKFGFSHNTEYSNIMSIQEY
jgi:hypothetical protein